MVNEVWILTICWKKCACAAAAACCVCNPVGYPFSIRTTIAASVIRDVRVMFSIARRDSIKSSAFSFLSPFSQRTLCTLCVCIWKCKRVALPQCIFNPTKHWTKYATLFARSMFACLESASRFICSFSTAQAYERKRGEGSIVFRCVCVCCVCICFQCISHLLLYAFCVGLTAAARREYGQPMCICMCICAVLPAS